MSLSLFSRLRAESSPAARLSLRNQLADQYALLVQQTARRLCDSWHLSWNNDGEDLVSEGYIGLIEAVESFDPENPKGARFETFAVRVISSKMAEFVRDHRGPVNSYRAEKGVRVIAESDLPDTTPFDSFEQRAGQSFAVFELNHAIERAFAAVDAEMEAESETVRNTWKRYRRAIELKFFVGAKTNEIAGELGISASNVCNVIKRGLELLRPHLSELFDV